jgi:hypothetical protein
MVGRVSGRVPEESIRPSSILKEVGSSCGKRESLRRNGLGWILSRIDFEMGLRRL